MQIVRQLDYKEQLVQESHSVIWIVDPKFRDILDVLLAQDHIDSPQHAHEIKHNQLARLVEFGQLEFA